MYPYQASTRSSQRLPPAAQGSSTLPPLLPPNAPRMQTIPLPPITSHARNTIRLHKLLWSAARPPITYDLRRSPSSAVADPRVARLEWAYESATNPPTQAMTLSCPILPQPIVVMSSCRDYDYVTLKDILSTVHEEFCSAVAHEPSVVMEREGNSILFSGHSTVLTRYMWAGLSDEISTGEWLLHVE